MSSEVIASMRSRIERMRKVIKLAHHPLIEQTIAEAEADIRKLETHEHATAAYR